MAIRPRFPWRRALHDLLLASIVAVLPLSCTDSDSGTSPQDPVDVIDKVEATVTSAGADLVLQNGFTLSIPPGAITGTADVELAQISGDTNFTASFQTVLRVQSDGTLSDAQLVIPLEQGQDTALVGVAHMNASGDRMTYMPGIFDPDNSALVVSIAGGSTTHAVGATVVASGTYAVSRGPSYTPVAVGDRFDIPYCQQYGDNCWAASMLIHLKSYKAVLAYDNIYEILHNTGIEKNDGYGWWKMGSMKATCESMTGLTAEKNTWIRFQNFLRHVFKCIDEDKPVLVNLITHQGVICGYEISNPGPNEVTSLYIHDPANWQTQTPYRKMTLDELISTYWNQGTVGSLVNYFVTINYTSAKLPDPNLVTIHLPDADLTGTSIASFAPGLVFGNDGRVIDRVSWDHTRPNGYSFENTAGIPGNMDKIKLAKAPIWNMDRTGSANVTVKSRLYRVVDGVFKLPALVEKVESWTVPPTAVSHYGFEIGIDEFVNDLTPVDTLFGIEVGLFDADNHKIDGFDVVFECHPLRITTIYPDAGEPGDEVTIWGIGFGNAQGTSTVEFNGEEADIVSWSSDEIVVEVPTSASSGDIFVSVGPATSNPVAFNVTGGILDLLHQTSAVLVQVYGMHTYSPNNFQTTGGMAYQVDTLHWTGTSFEINRVGSYNEQITVIGYVSADGRVVEHIDAYRYETGSLVKIFNVVLDSIPLASWYTPQTNVFYELKIDGASKDRHVQTIVNSKHYANGDDFQSYLNTDWDHATVIPEIRITFLNE